MNYRDLIINLKADPELIHKLSPRQFEELIAELLGSMGWTVNLTSQTRDGGYDIFAISKDRTGIEVTWVVEVKKFKPDHPVGVSVIRELYGTKQYLGVSQSLLVTSSRFSKDAIEFQKSKYDITLVDLSTIKGWINSFVPSPTGTSYIATKNFFSCFISYSHKDESFAKFLNEKLREQNIKVWYAPEDLRPGQKIHEEIDKAIKVFDKLLIVLSEHSMNSEWVKTEIRKARKRELEEKARVLFPISLTQFEKIKKWELFDSDSGKDLAVEIREYLIPDFSNWHNKEKFEDNFQKLLEGLKSK